MQIYAFDRVGHLVSAEDARKGENYCCPECRKNLRLRGGWQRQLHFYHLESTFCRLKQKSLTHLHIQYALQKMLAPHEVWLEHRFPEIGRIADVVWPEKKLIFEVQVSPISAEEISARNRDYQKVGFHVIWILHDRQFNRSFLSSAESFLRSSNHYFTNINASGRGIFYDQYSHVRANRRLKRSLRYPVYFKKVIFLKQKQFPSQFPSERKKWRFAFAGDLFHCGYVNLQKKTFINRWFTLPFRLILHLLLEKTCS